MEEYKLLKVKTFLIFIHKFIQDTKKYFLKTKYYILYI